MSSKVNCADICAVLFIFYEGTTEARKNLELNTLILILTIQYQTFHHILIAYNTDLQNKTKAYLALTVFLVGLGEVYSLFKFNCKSLLGIDIKSAMVI